MGWRGRSEAGKMATISYTTSYVLNMFTFIAYSCKNTYLAGFLFIPKVNPNMGTMAFCG